MYFERKGAKTQSVFLNTKSTKETEFFAKRKGKRIYMFYLKLAP